VAILPSSVIASQGRGNLEESQNSKIKDQNEEGFCFLNCNFDFLSLIFNEEANVSLIL